jgi:hypothetical protein
MSQQIRPLSYSQVADTTVTPGSLLTLTRGSRGAIGQWQPRAVGETVDPSDATVNVAAMVSAFNTLVWSLRGQGLVQAEPRFWFSQAGITGLIIQPSQGAGGIYKPYGLPPAPYTVTLIDVLTELNTLIGSGVGELKYEGGRVSLIVKSGQNIQFMDVSPTTSYDAALRLMRRLLPVNMESVYSGPTYVQGPLITGPIVGIYPVPAEVTNIIATPASTSIDLSWTSSASATIYYIYVAEVATTHTTTSTSYLLEGLMEGITYNITIVAGTPYEVSYGVTTQSTTTGGGGGLPTDFTISADNIGYSTITVSWSATGPYDIVFSSSPIPPSQALPGQPITLSAALGTYTFTGLQQNKVYTISAYLTDGSTSVYPSQPLPQFLLTEQIPAPNVISKQWNGTSVTYNVEILDPAVLIEPGQTIKYDFYVNDILDPDVSGSFDAAMINNEITGLNPETTYTVHAYYQLSNGQTSGLKYVDTIGPPTFTLSTIIEPYSYPGIVGTPDMICVDMDITEAVNAAGLAFEDFVEFQLQIFNVTADEWQNYSTILYTSSGGTGTFEWAFTQADALSVLRIAGFDPAILIRMRARFAFTNTSTYSAWTSYTQLTTATQSITLTVGPNTIGNTLEAAWPWSLNDVYNGSLYDVELSLTPPDATPSTVEVPVTNVDGGGSSYQFMSLTESVEYTVTGYLRFNTVPISGLPPTTITYTVPVPPPPTVFGVFASGLEQYGALNMAIKLNSQTEGPYFGYRVPTGSSWINYQFNRVVFPLALVNNQFPLPTVYSGSTQGYLRVEVYSGPTLSGSSTPISVSQRLRMFDSQYTQPYTFFMDSTVTITQNMFILFRAVINTTVTTNNQLISFYSYDNTGGQIPLVGIYTWPGTNLAPIDTNGVPQCNFELV